MNTVQKIRTKKNTPMRLGTRQALIGMSFIAPNFIGFLILTLIPVLFTFILSVCKWDGFNPIEFVGLKNFQKIFKARDFLSGIRKTVIYTVFTVSITTFLSLGLAVLINQKLKGIGFFRTALFFPYIASVVAVAAV